MRWCWALAFVALAGCGTFTCDCGDGRRMEQRYANPNTINNVIACAAFCGNSGPKRGGADD